MFKELKNYVYDNKFKITIYSDCVSICNYDSILVFDADRIIVKSFDKYIKVLGCSLVINRLYNKELCILGSIKSVSMEDFYD